MSTQPGQKFDFSETFGISTHVKAMVEARNHLSRHFPTKPWEEILLGAAPAPEPIGVIHYDTGAVSVSWNRQGKTVRLLFQGDGCVFHGSGPSDGPEIRLRTMSYVEEVLPRSVMLEILAVCRQKG